MMGRFVKARGIALRLAELSVAFALIFGVSAIWRHFSKLSVQQGGPKISSKEVLAVDGGRQQTGLFFDPARKAAFVRATKANIFADSAGAGSPVDQLFFGREVTIDAWDKTRRFVQVRTADGVSGYMHARDLSYMLESTSGSVSTEGAVDTNLRDILKKYLGSPGVVNLVSPFRYSLNGGVLRTNPALSKFQRALTSIKSKSTFSFNESRFGLAVLGFSESNGGTIIFPEASDFVSQARRVAPGTGVMLDEDGVYKEASPKVFVQGNATIKLRLTRELPATYVAHDSSRVMGLRDFSLNCRMNFCDLSVPVDLVSGPMPIRLVLFGNTQGLRPKISFVAADILQPFGIALVDFDGDEQQDLAVYSNKTSSDSREMDSTYVAYSENGQWHLGFATEQMKSGVDSLSLDPEPGRFDSPVVVRVATRRGSALAYSLTDDVPSCRRADGRSSVISAADILLESTAQITVVPCYHNTGQAEVLSAGYTIK